LGDDIETLGRTDDLEARLAPWRKVMRTKPLGANSKHAHRCGMLIKQTPGLLDWRLWVDAPVPQGVPCLSAT